MRGGDEYSCDACDRRAVARDDLCKPRCAKARDEYGRAPPPPAYELVKRDTTQSLGVSFAWLAREVRELRERRAVRAAWGRAGPVVQIEQIDDGEFTIEGTVELLRTADPHAPGVAAYRSCVLEVGFGQLGVKPRYRATDGMGNPRPIVTRIESQKLRRGCGVFLVRDPSGVALIDDDWLELFGSDLRRPGLERPGELLVRDGDLVSVTGHAIAGPLALPQAAGSYRGPPKGVRFDGGPDGALYLVLRDRGARAAHA